MQQNAAVFTYEKAGFIGGCAGATRKRTLRFGQPSFFGNSGDTPWTVADFDATQFFARFYIDN
jgi:hypothetical protein